MLQLAVIRQQPDFVKERLLVKNFDASAAVDTILPWMKEEKNCSWSWNLPRPG